MPWSWHSDRRTVALDWGVGGFAFLDSKRLVSSSSNFLFMRLQLDCSDNFCVMPAENDQGVYEVFRVKPPEVAYILGDSTGQPRPHVLPHIPQPPLTFSGNHMTGSGHDQKYYESFLDKTQGRPVFGLLCGAPGSRILRWQASQRSRPFSVLVPE